MATTREIKRRIVSVKNTQKITKAMEMVSSVKLRKARAQITAARPYAEKLAEMAAHMRESLTGTASQLLSDRPLKNIGLVVLTSDKGMCGGFNSNSIRKAIAFIKESEAAPVRITTIGKKGTDFFSRRKIPLQSSYNDVFFKPAYAMAESIGSKLLHAFLAGEIDCVYVAYNEFKSVGSSRVCLEKLLPVPALDAKTHQTKTDYLFEPQPEECIDVLLSRYFTGQLWRIILESFASEQSSRMTAMHGATKNAGELIEKLTLYYNKARQSAITKELLEVVSGAEALK